MHYHWLQGTDSHFAQKSVTIAGGAVKRKPVIAGSLADGGCKRPQIPDTPTLMTPTLFRNRVSKEEMAETIKQPLSPYKGALIMGEAGSGSGSRGRNSLELPARSKTPVESRTTHPAALFREVAPDDTPPE